MKIIIIITNIVIFCTTVMSASDHIESDHNGTFSTSVYCAPTFEIEAPAVINLGYFFPGSAKQCKEDKIKWILRGPRFYYGTNIPIEYTVVISNPNNNVDNDVKIMPKFEYDFENATPPAEFPFDGETTPLARHYKVKLRADGSGQSNCDGIAIFIITAWHITVQGNAAPGIRIFHMTLTASCSI